MQRLGLQRAAGWALLAAGAVSLGGCKKADDTGAMKSAVNSYYQLHPDCLFRTEAKFPTQADTNDDGETRGYDALVDQGLLLRTTAEKKKLLFLSKQVNLYDLSDKGRTQWTADSTQPGYGNFCYGHRVVDTLTVDQKATGNAPGAMAHVVYTTKLAGVPDWARAATVQSVYSKIAAQLTDTTSGQSTLVLTSDGWRVKPSTVDSDAGIVH